MKSLRTRAKLVTALAVVGVVVACGSTDQSTPGVAPQQRVPPTYLHEGTKVRLNLLTPQARARVAFKDRIQGTKNTQGQCEFRPNPATMRKSPLSAVVGEYDTETCAGLLYYFSPNPTPHPKPTSVETTFIQAPTDDARDVLVAAVKRAVQDVNVTTVRLDDTTLTRAVAARLDSGVDTGVITLPKRVTRPVAATWSMRILPANVRGDSASVHILEFTTMNNRPFMQGSLFTLVKRNGRWIVTDARLTGIS